MEIVVQLRPTDDRHIRILATAEFEDLLTSGNFGFQVNLFKIYHRLI
jgi:hypothetical protein